MTAPDAAQPSRQTSRQTIEAVFRMESPRVIGALMRLLGDLATAEELLQDALVAALEHWPTQGIPNNPGAWLTAAARRAAIDQLRHRKLVSDRQAQLQAEQTAMGSPGPSQAQLEAALGR